MGFFRNVLGTFLTEILTVVLNLALGVLTARALGPEGRGILTLVMTLPLTLAYFCELGISNANVFLIGRRKSPETDVAANSALIALIVGTAVGLTFWLARDLVLNALPQGLPSRYLAPILFLLPLLLLNAYWMAVLQALQRFALFNSLRLLMRANLLVGMVLALWLFKGGIGWAVATYAAVTILTIGLGLLVIGRLIRFKFAFDWPLARASLIYGSKAYLQNLVGHLTYRLDIYLVALFLTPSEVAFFSIATSIAELAWYIPNSVGIVLFPKLASLPEAKIHLLSAEACRHTLIITSIVALAVVSVSLVAVPLVYGTDYGPAVAPLIALGPGIVAMSLYKILTRNFASRDRQQVSLLIASIGLTLNISLDLLLIPHLGIRGAAMASSVAYCTTGVALLLAFKRESRLSWRAILRPQQADWDRYRMVLQQVGGALRKGRNLAPAPNTVSEP